jgi:murein DD-endopeptidase MepM/ murein hydrolase activator NlpD
MAYRTRLAAAGLFLALTLAAVPALLPVDLAGVGPGQRAEAATQGAQAGAAQGAPASIAVIHPLVHLRGGDLTSTRTASEYSAASEGVLGLAIAEAAPRLRTVGPGETLWKIAEEAGLGVEALAAANHLTVGTILRPGTVLLVPPLDPTARLASAQTHEVALGETLWGISHASGLSVETLAAANNLLVDAVLHPGQVLVMPVTNSRVTVQARRVRSRGPAVPADTGLTWMIQHDSLSETGGLFDQPSDGLITSRFGWRIHPIFGTREFHTGVDIANRMGTPIRAAEGGIVRFVGWMGGYGRLIVVVHPNGFETSYSHLSAILVTLGQRVVRGQVLARMGSSGWSTGPHLFFEVRRNGVPLDPVPFFHGAQEATVALGAPSASAAQGARSAATRGTQAAATPGTQAAATPSTQAPAAPGTQAAATPSTQAPAAPGTQAAAAPGTQAAATPSTQAPATPGTQAAATPSTQAPAAPPVSPSPASPARSSLVEERRSAAESPTGTDPTP